MPRRIRSKKVAIASILITVCILLSAFTFIQHSTPGFASADSNYRRHRTPTVGITPTSPIGQTPTPSGVPTSGGQNVQVFVEPAAGEQVILNAINNAKQSVWLEMYLMTDNNIIQALENAANRKLDVRVMLEPHPFGGGSPQSTLNALKAAGASVENTSPAFTLTHEKGMIIDGQTAFIMTCNFTFSALNGKNREYGIIDNTPQDVQGVIAIFNADWNRTSVQITDPVLVVSPTNSRSDLTTLITSAKTSLVIEAEELLDSNIEQAIAGAAQRGVNVQVILPTPQRSPDPNSTGISTIKAAGAQVKEDPQLIMHAKMLVVDGTKEFVGSENFSTNSLDSNRELGIFLSDQTVLSTLQQTFQQDWSISQSI